MIRTRGISEKIVYVYNPLPGITEQELFEKAKLDDVLEPGAPSPFEFTWQYGTGNERETVQIEPGDFLALRESEAKECMNGTNFSDMGLCVVAKADPADKDTKRAAVAALKKAAQFYHDRGTKQLIHQKKRHNYNESDMHDMRGQLHAYFINQAKEAAIREYLGEFNHRGRRRAEAA